MQKRLPLTCEQNMLSEIWLESLMKKLLEILSDHETWKLLLTCLLSSTRRE